MIIDTFSLIGLGMGLAIGAAMIGLCRKRGCSSPS